MTVAIKHRFTLAALALILLVGFAAGWLAQGVNVPNRPWIYKPGPPMTAEQLRQAEPWRSN